MTGFEEARARKALSSAKLDYTMPLTRASSVTNEVWLSETHVVRVNRRPDQRLRREAALGPHLPSEIGYPRIVGYGGPVGADWLVVERRPGTVLSRAWPTMAEAQRKRAVEQLARMLESLHRASTPPNLPDVSTPQLLGGKRFLSPVDPLLTAIDEAKDLDYVEITVLRAAEDIVNSNASLLDPWDTGTLVHGDLHFENVLWDGSRVTALLDFEWARGGPPDLDLDVFLRFCAYPFLHVAEDYMHQTRAEDYADVPFWLADAYPDLFAQPNQYERLRIYSIAYDVAELLKYPPQRRPRELSEFHPYTRLSNTVYGRGHLDRLTGTSAAEYS